MARGSVRREVRIRRPAAEVWDLVGDPARVHEWFTGIVSCTVDGTNRQIVTGSGLSLSEQILTNDPIQRRFQYRMTNSLFKEHLGTLDVIDLHDGTCLVVYATDADPRTMALTIGGAAGSALLALRERLEGAV